MRAPDGFAPCPNTRIRTCTRTRTSMKNCNSQKTSGHCQNGPGRITTGSDLCALTVQSVDGGFANGEAG